MEQLPCSSSMSATAGSSETPIEAQQDHTPIKKTDKLEIKYNTRRKKWNQSFLENSDLVSKTKVASKKKRSKNYSKANSSKRRKHAQSKIPNQGLQPNPSSSASYISTIKDCFVKLQRIPEEVLNIALKSTVILSDLPSNIPLETKIKENPRAPSPSKQDTTESMKKSDKGTEDASPKSSTVVEWKPGAVSGQINISQSCSTTDLIWFDDDEEINEIIIEQETSPQQLLEAAERNGHPGNSNSGGIAEGSATNDVNVRKVFSPVEHLKHAKLPKKETKDASTQTAKRIVTRRKKRASPIIINKSPQSAPVVIVKRSLQQSPVTSTETALVKFVPFESQNKVTTQKMNTSATYYVVRNNANKPPLSATIPQQNIVVRNTTTTIIQQLKPNIPSSSQRVVIVRNTQQSGIKSTSQGYRPRGVMNYPSNVVRNFPTPSNVIRPKLTQTTNTPRFIRVEQPPPRRPPVGIRIQRDSAFMRHLEEARRVLSSNETQQHPPINRIQCEPEKSPLKNSPGAGNRPCRVDPPKECVPLKAIMNMVDSQRCVISPGVAQSPLISGVTTQNTRKIPVPIPNIAQVYQTSVNQKKYECPAYKPPNILRKVQSLNKTNTLAKIGENSMNTLKIPPLEDTFQESFTPGRMNQIYTWLNNWKRYLPPLDSDDDQVQAEISNIDQIPNDSQNTTSATLETSVSVPDNISHSNSQEISIPSTSNGLQSSGAVESQTNIEMETESIEEIQQAVFNEFNEFLSLGDNEEFVSQMLEQGMDDILHGGSLLEFPDEIFEKEEDEGKSTSLSKNNN